ncbi:MAG TPA: CAP domain-containing protein [Gaiellaceae bacterium]|nr:CAP domain-containing protein [Gaiellaceae bacterium]
MADLETGLVQQLNVVRADHGLTALRANPKLATAASQHSREMANDGYFEHNSVDGTSFSTRIAKWYALAGYRSWGVAENLLWSSPSIGPSNAVALWMHSGGHRANILNPRWRDVGVGAVYSTTAGGAFTRRPVTIITADFGVRR